jgi:hypothetical protein
MINDLAAGQSPCGESAKDALATLQDLLALFPIHPTRPEPAEVMPCLLLGNSAHGENVELLQKLGVTLVINCAEDHVPRDHYPRLRAAGIDVVGFASMDQANYPLLEKHLDHVLELIRGCVEKGKQQQQQQHGDTAGSVAAPVGASNGKCFIHCQAGVNRSGALAIAALVEMTGLPLVEAAKRVKAARGRVCTNQGFQLQLVKEGLRRKWRLL